MLDITPPMPATWPAERHRGRHSHLLEVLSDLWRETTTDDQRHHIERALDAAELDARNWYR